MGFKDSGFKSIGDKVVKFSGDRYEVSGTEMPDFIPYIEKMLNIEIEDNDKLKEVDEKFVSPSKVDKKFYQELEKVFENDKFTIENTERLIHSHGQETFKDIYKVLYKSIDRLVDLVFYPESEEDVKKIIEIALKFNVCLIPYGGGTNVTRALSVPENEKRTVVSIDTRRLSKIEWINKEDRRVCVEAGITGKNLDELLKKEGFMIGHEPDSVELSTIGGWIATNASGMKKNKYGNIEDIVENVHLVTPKVK